MSKRNRSNESNFDRGWGSDKRLQVSRQNDGTLKEYTSLPTGSPPPGPGFTGVPDYKRSGFTFWWRIIPLIAGIFLCAWLRPMFSALVNAVV